MFETQRTYDVDVVTTPDHAAMTPDTLEDLARLVAGKAVCVLTGAGLSTDSGSPDYRGNGVSRRSPMSIDQFLSDEGYRKRYWAGSHRGWKTFATAQPNPGHRAIAAMEVARVVSGVVTQNVDGLHRRAPLPPLSHLPGAGASPPS